jgi:HEAT repeat protein
LLLTGVFLPLISVPILGNMNYIQNGHGDGIIILVLVALSGVLAIAKLTRGLFATGLAVFALLAFTFTTLQIRIADSHKALAEDLQGNPFAGLGQLAVESIQLQWGWAVLLIGAALVVWAATVAEIPRWPRHATLVKIAGALSIPVALVTSGSLTWLGHELVQELARREQAERIRAKAEAERRMAREAAEREEAARIAREEAERTAAEEEARRKAEAEATNQVLVPLPGHFPASGADDWPDSSAYVLQQGNLRLQVSHVTSAESYFVIHLALENAGDQEIRFHPWSTPTSVSEAHLLDDRGKSFRQVFVELRANLERTILPGKVETERLVFEVPVVDIVELRLQLAASAFGGKGQLRCRIPEAMLSSVLARFKGSAVVRDLCKALTSRKPEVRLDAAVALAKLGSRAAEAVPELTEAVNDTEPQVRVAAVRALGNIGTQARSAYPLLFKALADSSPGISQAAADSLDKLGPPTRLELELLRTGLKDANPSARAFSAKALGQLGRAAQPASSELVRALRDRESAVRQAAATALGALEATEETVDGLAQASKDKSPRVRREVINATARLVPSAGTFKVLVEGLGDSDSEVSAASEKTLANIDQLNRNDLQVLILAIKSADRKVRLFAVSAVPKTGREAKSAIDQLSDALGDKEDAVREQVAKTLGKIGPDAWPAAPHLGRCLSDKAKAVRQSAVAALRLIGPDAKAAVPAMIQALDDTTIHNQVIAAFIQLGKAAVPGLVGALEESTTHQRLQIIEVLSKMGSQAKDAVAALEERAASDPYPSVRRAAQAAVQRIK